MPFGRHSHPEPESAVSVPVPQAAGAATPPPEPVATELDSAVTPAEPVAEPVADEVPSEEPVVVEGPTVSPDDPYVLAAQGQSVDVAPTDVEQGEPVEAPEVVEPTPAPIEEQQPTQE